MLQLLLAIIFHFQMMDDCKVLCEMFKDQDIML